MNELIQLLLTSLIVFSGIPMGIYILFVAPEESEPGKKWFQLIMALLFSLSVFFSFKNVIAGIGLSIISLIALLMIPKQKVFFKGKYDVLGTFVIAALAGVMVGFAESILVPSFIMLFFVSFASYHLTFKVKDVTIKLSKVRHKWKYVWNGIWPNLSFFLGVAITLIF